MLEMLVYYLVFAVLLKRGTENFVPFLLIGIITWTWFRTTVQHCATSIVNSAGQVQQVYLPKTVYPLIVACTDTFKFIIAFSIIVLIVNIYGLTPSKAYIALPMVMIVQLLAILAFGLVCAAITPFFRDFELFLGYALHMVFFLSGIFYDPSTIPDFYRDLFFINPMARIINEYRTILIHGQQPELIPLSIIALLSIIVTFFSWRQIQKLDRVYPRVLAQ